jgi:hypothetical protein
MSSAKTKEPGYVQLASYLSFSIVTGLPAAGNPIKLQQPRCLAEHDSRELGILSPASQERFFRRVKRQITSLRGTEKVYKSHELLLFAGRSHLYNSFRNLAGF